METTGDQKRAQDAKKVMKLKTDKNERKVYIISAWNGFVNKYVRQQKCDSCVNPNVGAAIFEYRNGEIISSTDGFNIPPSELRDICSKVHDETLATRSGITVNGVNFKVVIADGRFGIYATSGSVGCSVCKTGSLICVWIHSISDDGAKCNEELMRLGDCFRSWEL